MTAAEFIAKWRNVELTERAAAQSHFNDLCGVVGHPQPIDVDKIIRPQSIGALLQVVVQHVSPDAHDATVALNLQPLVAPAPNRLTRYIRARRCLIQCQQFCQADGTGIIPHGASQPSV